MVGGLPEKPTYFKIQKNKTMNTPKEMIDRAQEIQPYEPTLTELKELKNKFIEHKRIDFLKFVEDEKGLCNREMINEWLDCDLLENN